MLQKEPKCKCNYKSVFESTGPALVRPSGLKASPETASVWPRSVAMKSSELAWRSGPVAPPPLDLPLDLMRDLSETEGCCYLAGEASGAEAVLSAGVLRRRIPPAAPTTLVATAEERASTRDATYVIALMVK